MKRILSLVLAVAFAVPTAAIAQDSSDQNRSAALVALWAGSYDMARQVQANTALDDALPGRVKTPRTLTVTPLLDSALGPNVILLEERKADAATIHRQRLHRIVSERDGRLRVQQLFFRDGPVYDREPAAPAALARLGPDDVDHVERCDLILEATAMEFRGSMVPRRCTYEHPRGGKVWAEFEMVLNASGYAYRDRSVIVESGAPKGQIEDFAWLRFDRLTPGRLDPSVFPSLSRQLGTWEGEFLRVDAKGEVLERFSSRIKSRLDPDGTYHQTNLYRPGETDERRIVSSGRVDGAQLRFKNDRVSGKAFDIDATTSVFAFTLPGNIQFREIVSLSPDGMTRHRSTQYLRDGELLRRTLINERKVPE